MPKKKKRKLPPCPDPANYILVRTKEGDYWRRKRGTIKPVTLNKAFARNSNAYKVIMPAIKRILAKLEPFTHCMYAGRLASTMAGALVKDFDGEKIDYSFLKGFEYQPEYPLHKIVCCHYGTKIDGRTCLLTIDLHKGEVLPQNTLVTSYYFELIILWGDAVKERGLRIDSTDSPLFLFGQQFTEPYTMEISLPASPQPWMVLLKVACHEGNMLAKHPKHYAMKIIETGNGII
jgi:hypothetical protein